MADQTPGTAMRLLADLSSTGLTGTVTLTDPLGAAETPVAFIEVGLKRYRVTVTPTSTVQGLWTAVWKDGSNTILLTQTFTVDTGIGATRYEVRLLAARKVSQETYEGVVTSGSTTTIVDDDLYGGDLDYNGYWLLRDPDSDESGSQRRVSDYDGTTHTLTVSRAWATAPSADEDYCLFPDDLSPRDLDRELANSIRGIADAVLVPLHTSALVPTKVNTVGEVTLPTGWEYVYEVWNTDSTGNHTRVSPDGWDLGRGRKLQVTGADDTWSLDIYGLRQARVPLWDHSVLDVNPLVLIAGMATAEHQDEAGGAATDVDVHLQRSAQAFAQYGALLTTRTARIPHNTRRIKE